MVYELLNHHLQVYLCNEACLLQGFVFNLLMYNGGYYFVIDFRLCQFFLRNINEEQIHFVAVMWTPTFLE